jgi:hypothetical protein
MRDVWQGVTRGLGSLGIFLIAATVTSVFFINFCATIFQCGCQLLWTAADQYCNIHAAHGKHCPWCSFGYAGYAGVYGTIIASQALVAFGGLWWGWHWFLRLITSLAAFPFSGLVLALLLGWYTEYWN